eukprot:scaffold16951_cov48-Attheya_sp.AAC.5
MVVLVSQDERREEPEKLRDSFPPKSVLLPRPGRSIFKCVKTVMRGRKKSPPPTPANSPRATKSGKCTLGMDECARHSLSISLPMANISKKLDETVKHRAVAKNSKMYNDSTEHNATCVNAISLLEPPRNSSTGRRYERRFSSSQNMIEEVVRKMNKST